MMTNLQSSAFVARTTQLLSSVAHLRLLLVMLLTLSVSADAWGADVVYKTAKFGSAYNSAKVSSYTSSWYSTYDGFRVDIVNANNNNNGWSYIKMGSKNAASTGTITTNAEIDAAITKVSLTIDAITTSNITSITLKTATSSNGTYTSVGTFTKAKGTQTVTLASPTANLFYKIEVVCTKGSSNGLIQISQVDYYKSDVVATPEYNITYTGDEHITYSSTKPETIKKEDSGFELEFSVDDGYQLNDIQVKMGGQDLVVDEDYLWEEGYLLILPETDITGDIEIIFETVATCTNPIINTQPVSATYTKGATATALKVVVSGDDLTYQWYSNTSNSTSGATKISDATSSTYTPSTSTVGTKYYYCIVSSGSCSTTSNIVSVVVKNPPFTVTLNAGPGTCAASVTETSSGAGVTLPTPTLNGCDEWTFAGWKTTSAVAIETTTKPTLIAAGNYMPSDDITLYAVYQRTETTEGGGSVTSQTDEVTISDFGTGTSTRTYSATYADWTWAKNSGSNIATYDEIRLYASHSMKISPKSGYTISSIVATCTSTSYANALAGSSLSGAGKSVSGSTVTITPTSGNIVITQAAQSRVSKFTVTYSTTAGGTTTTTYYYSNPSCVTETAVYLIPFLGYCKYEHVRSGNEVVSLLERYPSLSHQIDFHHINMSKITLAAKPLL